MRTHEMKVVDVAIEDIQQHPENANNGDLDAISESIEVNGFFTPILVQRSTGFILVGNHRFAAAIELGSSTVPVIYLDVDDSHAKRIMLADNRTARLGVDDEAQLVELLDQLYATDIGLGGTGYDYNDLERLHATLDEPLHYENDDELGLPGLPKDVDVPDREQLSLSIVPSIDENGVIELSVMRADYHHITLKQFKAVCKALGIAMGKDEIKAFGVEQWSRGN